MPEQIIDIRQRIEKMRIKFEDDQKLSTNNNEILDNKVDQQNFNEGKSDASPKKVNKIINEKSNNSNALQNNKLLNNSETNFPSVSLSVKNPISSKILVILMLLQVFSNIGIFVLLYNVLE